VKRICNLEQKEGFECKIEGLGAVLELVSKFQGLK
jgi:hypothetical protein